MNDQQKRNIDVILSQLLMAISYWKTTLKEPPPASMHLPHVVCLLQSVGFNISRIDGAPPSDVTPLRNGQKGTRVVITCGHSGQRCYLEMPEIPEKCKCLKTSDNSQNNFWEVTGKNNGLIESGSNVSPPISFEMSYVISNMLTYLIHLIQNTPLRQSINTRISNTTTSNPSTDASSESVDQQLPEIVITLLKEDEATTLSNKSPGAKNQTPHQKTFDPPLVKPRPFRDFNPENLLVSLTNETPNIYTLSLPGNRTLRFTADKTKSVSSPDLSGNNSNSPIPTRSLADNTVTKPIDKTESASNSNKPTSPIAAQNLANKSPVTKPIDKTKLVTSPNNLPNKKPTSPIIPAHQSSTNKSPVIKPIDKSKSVSSPNLSKNKLKSPIAVQALTNKTPVTKQLDKTKSSPNLSNNKPKVAQSSTKKNPVMKQSVLKPLNVKFPGRTTPTATVKTPTTLESKISNDRTKSSAGRARKSIDLYAHVKSTIPKPTSVGKIVKKK